MKVNVIGAGLAGTEASYQLAKRGFEVYLYDIKPEKFTEAHSDKNFAELVCSNSLKSAELTNACGLLKYEMDLLDSLFIKSAKANSLPAGTALAVDREGFAKFITDEIMNNPNIHFITKEVTEFDISEPTIIATGPLTTSKLSKFLETILGDNYLYFYDAVAPIVTLDSIDMNKAFIADRYNKGEGDYINCGLNKEEYYTFVNELVNAQSVILKSFEKGDVFEGCMPVEIMAKRDVNALRFGPMKPVGIVHPVTNQKYYAVLQLRRDNLNNTLYNMVGFQTNLTFPEQKRVFSLIPGLENAEYVRYGVMHRNTFINAPALINEYYQLKEHPNIFIAGQLSGVEGYVESASSGLMCGINMAKYLENKNLIDFTSKTAIGSLPNYISKANIKNFQPMNANYGIIDSIALDTRDKKVIRNEIASRAIQIIKDNLNNI